MENLPQDLVPEKMTDLKTLCKDGDYFCDLCLERIGGKFGPSSSTENTSTNNSLVSKADLLCVECKQKLCYICFRDHVHKDKSDSGKTLKHRKPDTNDQQKLLASQCEYHKGEPAGKYCGDCNKAVCGRCQEGDHKGHNCKPIELVTKSSLKQLKENLDQVTRNLEESKKLYKSRDLLRTSYIDQLTKMDAVINNRVREITNLVQAHKNSLLSTLNADGENVLKEVESGNCNLYIHLQELNDFEKIVQDASCGRKSEREICCAANELAIRSRHLEKSHAEVLSKEGARDASLKRELARFRPSNFEEWLVSEGNIIGTFQPQSKQIKINHLKFEIMQSYARLKSHASHRQVNCESHASHVQVTCMPQACHMQITCKSHRSHINVACKSHTNHMQVTYKSHTSHM